MPPPDWQSATEVFPAGWVCPAEPFWVAGWATSPTLVPVDVRAHLGGRVFLGLCGLPNADRARDPAGRAAFCFLLQPVAGATEIRLEICDQHGRWTTLLHAAVTSATSGAPTPATGGPSPRTWLRLLEAHAARPAAPWRELAREVLDAEAATPLDVLPSPPFFGALEGFGAEVPMQYRRLLIRGWIAHRTHRITRLTACLDTADPQPLAHGLSRPDAAELGIELCERDRSRFVGYLTVPTDGPLPLALRIFAELGDGRRELVFARRFRPIATRGSEPGLPPFSAWKLARASWALYRARPWPAGAFWPAVQAARRAYRAEAPRLLVPVRTSPESAESRRPLRLTLVTHNLAREGAPLIALEFARFLACQPGWSVRVLSPQDGPLRREFESAGLPVELVDVQTLLESETAGEFQHRLRQLGETLQFGATDLVVVNTMVPFWAVLLARDLRRPSLLYTHESVSVRRYFTPDLAPALIAEAEDAFAGATRVVFSAAASQRVHGHAARTAHFRVLPGWIDVARINAYTRDHTRAGLRQKLDLPAGAVVFANIGSVAVRKGQQVFVDAITTLLRGLPPGGPELVFLIVGAPREADPYVDLLRHTLAERQLTGVHLIEQVADPYAYFGAADLFVGSSFEEAFPRVVMEAAVFGLPVVSTNVDGIPEMLGPDEAWLVSPGDSTALAGAMAEALRAHLAGDRTRADRAQAAVAAKFDSAVLLPRHRATVCAVAEMPVA